ncbi:hypothetical protein B0H16DRAFT_1428417, partial [Mycena metata]
MSRMPRRPTATEIRISSIAACLTPALALLSDVNDTFGTPFIQPIIKTTEALIAGIQDVKKNKNKCFQLVKSIHQILYPIIHTHLNSKAIGPLPPQLVEDIGKFAETLQKIYTFIGILQDGNRIKQFFRQSEANGLLKDCHVGLDQAMDVFKVQTGLTALADVIEVQKQAEVMHRGLLELVSTHSDGTLSDGASTIFHKRGIDGLSNSSNSFSLLPSKPKILYGRDSELRDIMQLLVQDAPRILILGGGGMGKTSLARTALHHTDTCTKFPHRFFVSAEPATTVVELAALIGLHLGLEPRQNLTRPINQYFAQQRSRCLLVLDNLETPWEPMGSRDGVEDFLSLLADIENLAIIITMRGSERPGKVCWSRPFLLPLQPLSDDAAQQIFEEIMDDSQDSAQEILELLKFTANMPLAVDLMAHLVQYEGLTNVLTRWKTEKTSLLAIGYDRNSNLDASIAISISSPRITTGARELLALLLILPDGLSDAELLRSDLPINAVLSCKSILIATSLAYKDTKGRLRSLVPIREHMRRVSPPSQALVESIQKWFHALLASYQQHKDARREDLLMQITANLANLEEVLRQGLQPDSLNLSDTIQCILYLSSFHRVTRSSTTLLLQSIPLDLCNHRLHVLYIMEHLSSLTSTGFSAHYDDLVSQGLSHLQYVHDPLLEAQFYRTAGGASLRLQLPQLQFLERALELSTVCGYSDGQCNSLILMAHLRWRSGDSAAALVSSRAALQLAYQTGRLYQASRALEVIAACLVSLGNYTGGIVQLTKAKELLSVCGITGGPVHHQISTTQAEIYMQKSEYPEARSIHMMALQDTVVDPSSSSYANVLLNIALIDVLIGASKEIIEKNLDTARKIFTNVGYIFPITQCDTVSADLKLREGDTTSARKLFQKCLRAGWGPGMDIQVINFCLERLADVTKWPPEFHGQMQWPVIYLCLAHKTRDKLGFCKALFFIGEVFSDEDEVTVHSLFIVALEEFTRMDIHCNRAQCMTRLGDLAQRNGEHKEAAELWKSARPLFERSLQTQDVAQIDSRLAALDGKHPTSIAHQTQ